jgi:SAM-dependent methyltransferase
MYERAQVEEERLTWQNKPQLRLLKDDYYRQIRAWLPARGRVVEIGAGCGGLKASLPKMISSDIFPTPWVDLVMAAERLAFRNESIDGLVGLDVLHHMEDPLAFFHEAARVLRTDGTLILLDPYVSLGSWIPWHCIHHERCTMREPFDLARGFTVENNARATLWFDRHWKRMESLIRPFQMARVQFLDVFYYPLSGGFRRWSLIPQAAAPAALKWDRRMGDWFGKWFGYRMLLVFHKRVA